MSAHFSPIMMAGALVLPATMDGMIEAFPGWLKPENGVLKAMVAV